MNKISENCLKCLAERKSVDRCSECPEYCWECKGGAGYSCECFADLKKDYAGGEWHENCTFDMGYDDEKDGCVTVRDYKNDPACQFKEGERKGQCQQCKNSMQFCLCGLKRV